MNTKQVTLIAVATSLTTVAIVAALLWVAGVAGAGPLASSGGSVPRLINYQGRLTDAAGNPLNGSYNMTFCLYAAATGGTALWCETQPVNVSYGVFNALLGSVTPIPSSCFSSSDLRLGVRVGSDSEMTPRRRVVSAGYAYKAEDAGHAIQADQATEATHAAQADLATTADTVDGFHASASPEAGKLVPLGANARLPASALPLSVAQAVGTTDIGAPGGETDMPDMALTLTTYGAKLLCVFTAPVYYGGGSSNVYTRLYIDSAQKNTTRAGTSSGTTQISSDTMTIIWLEIGLTPGTHNVKITWWGGGGYGAGQPGASDGKRVLTCLDLN